ncbi:MAG: hypothetical protein KC550_02055 [Nanoarchaeota archaeon]|nr:hypothetical protein [Nanoarchaeota archaeon]
MKLRYFLFLFIFVFGFVSVSSYTNISSCADDIVSSGVYHMNQSFGDSSNCLNINSDDVYLDCKGYGIYNSSVQGIYSTASRNNLTIVNCNLNGTGFSFGVPTSSNFSILNSTIFNSTNNGIYVACNDCLFENINISYVGAGGIYVNAGSNIKINNIQSHFNVQGLILVSTSNSIISNIYTYNNTLRGLGVGSLTNNNNFSNLDLRNNTDGIKFFGVNGNNSFNNSIIKDNLNYDIDFSAFSNGNIFYNNIFGNASKIYSSNWTANSPNFWNYSGVGNTYDLGNGSFICFDEPANLNCDYFPTFLSSGGVSSVTFASAFPFTSFLGLFLGFIVLIFGFFV